MLNDVIVTIRQSELKYNFSLGIEQVLQLFFNKLDKIVFIVLVSKYSHVTTATCCYQKWIP